MPTADFASFNRAVSLHASGHLLAAREAYEEALREAPGHAGALGNLAVLTLQLGDPLKSEALARQAIAADGKSANAWNNLGLAVKALSRFAEAEQSFHKCLELDPRHEQAWNNLGETRATIGDLEGAIAAYGHALKIKPELPAAVMAYIHRKMQIADWDGLDEAIAQMSAMIRKGMSGIEAFGLLFCCQDPAEILRTARNCAREITLAAKKLRREPLRFDGPRAGKLRIGYVSANFYDHAVGTLVAQMLESHDRTRFEIHGYCHSSVQTGDLRRRIVSAFDTFTDIRAMNDLEAASKINAGGIDILVDLMGYTKDQRLGIFALRPSPIQISWIGFAGSVGGRIMDYIIGDAVVIPEGHAHFYDEKILFMPGCYQVNDARRALAKTAPTRSQYGLSEDAVVFCCFNQIAKITPPILDLWAAILKQVPNGLLWLWRLNEPAVRNLTKAFASRDIGPERLRWAETLDGPEHLSRYAICDLFLDTFPYCGHATASNSLFGGCPVLALPGATFASRVSSSLLTALALPELIATSPEDYVRKAVTLGRDRRRLSELKELLIGARKTSALFDGAQFARDLENGFVKMIELYRSGHPPAHIGPMKSL